MSRNGAGEEENEEEGEEGVLRIAYDPMSLVTGTKLAKSYGPQDVFTDLTVAVPHGARIAIVGPNGVGKTTLLRLLAGVEAPSAGAIHQARGLTACRPWKTRIQVSCRASSTSWWFWRNRPQTWRVSATYRWWISAGPALNIAEAVQ